MIMLLTLTIVEGAAGAAGTTATSAITMFDCVLKPIEFRD